MSSGASGAVQFQFNKNSATQGVFFQREKPKNELRKFGYKSKNLRHPIRQPDYQEEIERMQKAADEEKRKFNKKNTDFIRRNRERYRPKETDGQPAPGSTHIAPGTVTLTQEQLAALLKTLGKTSHGGGSGDSPMRISIDAENNKIEVERYESEDEPDSNGKRENTGNNDDNDSDVGIEALLEKETSVTKPKSKKQPDRSDLRSRESHRAHNSVPPKPQSSSGGPGHASLRPHAAESRTSVNRLSWDDAKKEAGVSHVPDIVPWKHLTMAERKRLQWARERAEVPEDYNPWGRPGAGAPTQKQAEEVRSESQAEAWITKGAKRNERPANNVRAEGVKSSNERKKEELANEILQLQQEIRAAEQKHQKEEKLKEKRGKDDAEEGRKMSRQGQQPPNKRAERGREKNKRDTRQQEEQAAESKVQIVIINKKKDRPAGTKGDKKVSGDENEKEKRADTSMDRHVANHGSPDQKYSQPFNRSRDDEAPTGKGKESEKEVPAGRNKARVAPPAPGLNRGNEEENLSKKEIERRKWLAELDKQREEQRLKKQMEKERDRAGLQDQWADRFVYHKTPQQISPRHEQAAQPSGPRTVQAGPPVSRAGGQTTQGPVYDTVDNAPPAAMRSSMVVGDGSLNQNRYDNKKAEEKRKWLQELEQQREEQRLAKQAQKERDRQENNGTWADHYQTDRQKLNHTMPHHLGQHQQEITQPLSHLGVSPRAASNNAGSGAADAAAAAFVSTQRTSSAPQPPAAVSAAPEEGTTFLRGQGAFIDPVTRREQEEKRRVHLEYQAQIKAQIEEKEKQKREERERKAREDMEEERKLQVERENFNKQLELEQRKLREKEEQRQKQIAALKSAMDEAQEKAMEEKSHKRIHHLQTHGHDVTHLKATYDVEPSGTLSVSPQPAAHVAGRDAAFNTKTQGNVADAEATPRSKQFDPSGIPGLGPDLGQHNQRSSPTIQDLVDSARFEPAKQEQGRVRHPIGQSYTKEPYVENRVLTPSRFRGTVQTTETSGSPRREFGTQTLELSDLQNILKSLPEDIQIEYKLKVEDALREKEERARNQQTTRKVHVKSGHEADRKGGKPPPAAAGPGKKPVREKAEREKAVREKAEREEPKQRLAWNQKQRKTVVKNSERDPFYQQKREQSEARRARRERQLQYLQELNSGNIPTEHHSRSKSRHEHCSPRRDGEPEAEEHRGRKVANSRVRGDNPESNHLRHRSHSPNILSLLNPSDGAGQRKQDAGNARHGRRSKSPAPRYPLSTGRSSPPIPAVRHRTAADPSGDKDPYLYANQHLRDSQSDTRYGDAAILPVGDGEFVPFMRTTEILDPARAEEPMAMSRENSRMERARRAYRETHNPAGNGRKVEIYQDREREAALKQASQNPLMNPGLVTDHPTARQDMILQQLSSLKQTLMQRQKELETYMSPAELEAEAARAL